jgi:hypothetical protein
MNPTSCDHGRTNPGAAPFANHTEIELTGTHPVAAALSNDAQY